MRIEVVYTRLYGRLPTEEEREVWIKRYPVEKYNKKNEQSSS